jgi:hypothetical protein
MPDPADAKTVLETLNKLGLDSDETPDEISAQDQNPNDEANKGKAARAWHDLRNTLKAARGVIEELTKEKPAVAPAAQSSNANDRTAQADQYLTQLKANAQAVTGINDPNHPLVQLEMQRLHTTFVQNQERSVQAERDSEKVFNETVAGYKQFEDADKVELKKRLAGFPPLEKANVDTIKRVANQFIGENWDRFAKAKPAGKSNSVESDAAAVSSLKARGGVGVGDASVGGKGTDDKPATAEELAEMKKLRIPDGRVDLLRKAKAKKGNYSPGM